MQGCMQGCSGAGGLIGPPMHTHVESTLRGLDRAKHRPAYAVATCMNRGSAKGGLGALKQEITNTQFRKRGRARARPTDERLRMQACIRNHGCAARMQEDMIFQGAGPWVSAGLPYGSMHPGSAPLQLTGKGVLATRRLARSWHEGCWQVRVMAQRG